eukprot:12348427-Ditylum_brightwellii.AAC.1
MAFKKASFNTVAGNFHTAGVVKAAFQLTGLNPTAKINFKLHVVNSLGVYNMILGRDTIMRDDSSIPMKTTSAQASDSFYIKDPKGINDM